MAKKLCGACNGTGIVYRAGRPFLEEIEFTTDTTPVVFSQEPRKELCEDCFRGYQNDINEINYIRVMHALSYLMRDMEI